MRVNWTFLLPFLFILIILNVSLVNSDKSDQNFDDKRCKCTCPSLTVVNETENNRRIYIATVKAEDCKCDKVILINPLPKRFNEFCALCKCKFEIRNTTTIKVVVLIIICIVSLLVIYMLFLLCLDPLMNRRPKTYQEQQNEEVNLDDQTVTTTSASMVTGAMGRSRKASNLVNRVKDTQEKWKGTVKEQRRHIYDAHTMLN